MRRTTASGIIFISLFMIALVLGGMAIAKMETPTPVAQPETAGGKNSISGTVYDARHNGIPGAKVTLYYTAFLVNDYKATDPVSLPDNPQLTSDGRRTPAGFYGFTGIPADVYIVTAEKDGIAYSEIIQVREGTKTADLTIPGYVDKGYTTPTPTVEPRPTAYGELPSVGAPIIDLGAILMEALRLLGIGVIGLQLIVGIVVIALHIGRQD